jgi:hypothetical protein
MKSWKKWLLIVALGAVAAYVFRLFAVRALYAGVQLVRAVVYPLAYVFLILVPPLGAFVLVAFVYWVFLRVRLRAWRISRIRNARELREIINRGKGGES